MSTSPKIHFIFIFLFSCFLRVFFLGGGCIWSNQIQEIFKQIYLTHRWILTDTNTLGQSSPWRNDDEGILHTPQMSKTWTSPSDAVQCHTMVTLFWGSLTPLHILNPPDRAVKDTKETYCLSLNSNNWKMLSLKIHLFKNT